MKIRQIFMLDLPNQRRAGAWNGTRPTYWSGSLQGPIRPFNPQGTREISRVSLNGQYMPSLCPIYPRLSMRKRFRPARTQLDRKCCIRPSDTGFSIQFIWYACVPHLSKLVSCPSNSLEEPMRDFGNHVSGVTCWNWRRRRSKQKKYHGSFVRLWLD